MELMSGDNFRKIGYKTIGVSNRGGFGFATLPIATMIPLMRESDHMTSLLETCQGFPFLSASKPKFSEASMTSAVLCLLSAWTPVTGPFLHSCPTIQLFLLTCQPCSYLSAGSSLCLEHSAPRHPLTHSSPSSFDSNVFSMHKIPTFDNCHWPSNLCIPASFLFGLMLSFFYHV